MTMETHNPGLTTALAAYLRGWAEEREDDNEAAFRRHVFLPRVMTGQGGIDVTRALLGMTMGAPLIVGAFAADRLFHPEGLLPIARVCRALRLPLVVSEETVTPLEAITAAHDLCWLQIRGAGTVERATRMIDLAATAGARGLVVTLLAPTHPSPGQQPAGLDVGRELAGRGWRTVGSTGAGIGDVAAFPQWTWKTLRAVVAHAASLDLPVIAKGVLHPDDVMLAREAGCAAAMVSNVGRRQVRAAVAPLDMLAEISTAAPGHPLLLDGGVRSGSDAVVALCLGAAAAVMVRPVAAALAQGGEAGVARLLGDAVNGLTASISWLGVETPDALGPRFLRPAASLSGAAS